MSVLSTILVIYGVLCVFIGITKIPAIWNMGKLKVMAKIFKGDRNLQIFIIVWGIIALAVGIVLR